MTSEELLTRMGRAAEAGIAFSTAMRHVGQVARAGTEIVEAFRRAFPNDLQVVTTEDGETRLIVRRLGGFTSPTLQPPANPTKGDTNG